MMSDEMLDGEPLPQRTGLDFVKELRAERQRAKTRTVTWRDSDRPEFVLTLRVPSDMDVILGIESRAEEQAGEAGAPAAAIIQACMTMAMFTTELKVRGAQVSTGDGSPFADPALQEALGVKGARGASWRAVRELYITEGGGYDDVAILRVVNNLTTEMGVSQKSVHKVDPT